MAEMHQRIKTKLEFALESPVLQLGEHGLEKDTGQFKIGDGVTKWNALDYSNQGGSGSSSLIVVTGGSVTLDNSLKNGDLVGYHLTGEALIQGVPFEPGTYGFQRDFDEPSGWSYRTLDVATPLPYIDIIAPTPPTLTVDDTGHNQLVSIFSGGTDSIGVAQYRVRLDDGPWIVDVSPYTFSGLTPETEYTIEAQAGDDSDNWSTSDFWVGSTAAAPLISGPEALPSLLGWWDASDESSISATGSRVDTWNNLVSDGQDLSRGSYTGPMLTADALGSGRDGLVFSTADSTRIGVDLEPNPTNPWTIGMVFKWNNANNDKHVFGSQGVSIQRNGGSVLIGGVNSDQLSIADSGGTATHLLTLSVDVGGQLVMRLDGVKTVGSGSEILLHHFFLGATANVAEHHADITVGEAWYCGAIITDAEYDELFAYAQNKWGVPAWTSVASDDFTGANGTSIAGRTTTTGGLAWSAHPSGGSAEVIQNNQAMGPSNEFSGNALSVGGSPTKIRISADYDVSVAGSWAGIGIGVVNGGAHFTRDVLMRDNGSGTIFQGSTSPGDVTSGKPTIGKLTMEGRIGGTVITVSIDGTVVGTTVLSGGDVVEAAAATRFFTTGGRLDNFLVETM